MNKEIINIKDEIKIKEETDTMETVFCEETETTVYLLPELKNKSVKEDDSQINRSLELCDSASNKGNCSQEKLFVEVFKISENIELGDSSSNSKLTLPRSISHPSANLGTGKKALSKGKGDKRKFKCDICNHRSVARVRLIQHLRTHTGEKPFQCNQCIFTTSRKDSLQKHLKIHTGEKPFKCSFCSFTACRKDSIQAHLKTHSNEKPFKCSYCSFTASWKNSIQNHLKTHTGEKPYQCSHCQFRTSRNCMLKKHFRRHTGERPYRCNYCSYSAAYKQTLQKHISRKHTIVHQGCIESKSEKADVKGIRIKHLKMDLSYNCK